MPETTKVRMFFFLWLCYSLIMSTLFQSFFTSFLIEPGLEKQISTMEELMNKSWVKFVKSSVLFGFVIAERAGSLLELTVKLNSSEKSIEEFFKTNNSAVIASDLDMKVKIPAHYFKCLSRCSFVCFGQSGYSVDFLPSSHYFEAFNSKVLQCFEAGLFIHLEDNFAFLNLDSIRDITQLEHKVNVHDIADTYFKLNVQHLNIVFYILICGYIFSFIVFIAEIICFKIKMK